VFDYDRLLRVLLTKKGEVRLHYVQQNADDCSHAEKVTGARRAFQLVSQVFDLNVGRKTLGINLFYRRRKYVVDIVWRQQFQVAW